MNQGIEKLQDLFPSRICSSVEAQKKYGPNTLAIDRIILGAISPKNNDEILTILSVCNEYDIKLYPISTGHNWGYGGAVPPVDNCLILDLSKMNQITLIDRQLGLISVEPGVTQGQLKKFLDENHLPFVVPVTGAGPNCSILGNALDRGYGLTPYIDHFFSVMRFEAILADGTLYQGKLNDLGGTLINKVFKWGLGPYIDGLLGQGNFAIVTGATIALTFKPLYQEGFFFTMASIKDLSELMPVIQEIYQTVGGHLGSIKITNQHLVLEAIEKFPDKIREGLLFTHPEIKNYFENHPMGQWFGSTSIFGDKRIVKIAKKIIKKKLKGKVKKLYFIRPNFLKGLIKFFNLFFFLKKLKIKGMLEKLVEYLALLEGQPSQIALPLAYLYNPDNLYKNNLNPDQDECGLMWFSPLVPMKKEEIQIYVEKVTKICIENKIEPILTLSAISDRCIDSAVPILFNRKNPQALENAKRCYEVLFKECQALGFIPYRIPVSYMSLITDENLVSSKIIKKIKNALDPKNIIAPGRYGF